MVRDQPTEQNLQIEYTEPNGPKPAPVNLDVDTDPVYSEFFSYATLECINTTFNSILYKQMFDEEYFDIVVFAENRSGISKCTIHIEITNVNNPPDRFGSGDFFSIMMDEDTSFNGINMDGKQLRDVIYDRYDPYDTLTYQVEKLNYLADNITVDLESDGSNITFTPADNWCCPYVKSTNRLKGRDDTTFAEYRFNITDQAGGRYLSDSFWVYVKPVNDEPVMENIPSFSFSEGETVLIDMDADDPDLGWEQELRFATNITQAVYDNTGVQLEFFEVDGEEYDFDEDEGILEFPTNNEIVGTIPVEARVMDRSTVSHSDYRSTPYPVYSNFTIHISNVNSPPTAIMDSPVTTLKYNTTGLIEFNASRSGDDDLIHGQELNYTWFMNGEILGYGMVLKSRIGEEGTHNITLVVSDGEFTSEVSRDIQVLRTIVPGEKFRQANIDRSYPSDEEGDAVVVFQSEEKKSITIGGKNSLDITSLKGVLEGAKYRITVRFNKEWTFLDTQTKHEPILKVYFMKPSFEEDPPIITLETIKSNNNFQSPPGSFIYRTVEVDLRLEQILRPTSDNINPQVRMLSNNKGLELTMTVVEMDYMGVEPDFELFASAHLRTTKEVSEGESEFYESWDTAGFNSKEPATQPTEETEVEENGDESNLGIIIAIIIAVLIILIVIIGVVIVIIKASSGKKDEEEDRGTGPKPTSIEEELGLAEKEEPSAGIETKSITPGDVPDKGW